MDIFWVVFCCIILLCLNAIIYGIKKIVKLLALIEWNTRKNPNG